MNGVFGLGGGLEMLVINSIDFTNDARAIEIVNEGVGLQNQVFAEQGVSYPDKRVLLAEDSVGTPDEPGSLDGSSPTYHHLYLLHQGKLIGMRVSEKLKVEGLGDIILDYFPPLVPKEEAGRAYGGIFRAALAPGKKRGGGTVAATPIGILMAFSKHQKGSNIARFTDGIGIRPEALIDTGYLRSETPIWVPPLDAKTREDYLTVLKDPVHMQAQFAPGFEPRINKKAADWLFVQKYLKEGYIDSGQLRRIGLGINTLPSVTRTREAIAEATGVRGYIAFWPIDTTR